MPRFGHERAQGQRHKSQKHSQFSSKNVYTKANPAQDMRKKMIKLVNKEAELMGVKAVSVRVVEGRSELCQLPAMGGEDWLRQR